MIAEHCDREGCVTWSRWPLSHGFLKIMDRTKPDQHFCSWDCVLKYAATKTLLEVISNE